MDLFHFCFIFYWHHGKGGDDENFLIWIGRFSHCLGIVGGWLWEKTG
jgi:hypothetical protein